MTRKRLFYTLILTLLLSLALPAFATPKNSKELGGNIVAQGNFTLSFTRSLNGATLQPGEYKVVATDSQVSFLRGRKIVAQATIQWKDAELAAENTIMADNGSIREIQFKGKKRSVVVM
jgi:hypothetical protein